MYTCNAYTVYKDINRVLTLERISHTVLRAIRVPFELDLYDWDLAIVQL